MAASSSSSFPLLDNRLDIEERFRYVHSCDLEEASFKIKIGCLEGSLDKSSNDNLLLSEVSGTTDQENPSNLSPQSYGQDIKITCELWSSSRLLCPCKETTYRSYCSRWNWNEWVAFPVRISDLQRDTVVKFTLWTSKEPGVISCLGTTCISAFSKYSLLRRGMYDLKVWEDEDVANGNTSQQLRSGKTGREDKGYVLNKMKKRYERGQMVKVDWLDRLTFPEMERIQEMERKQCTEMHLSIEFPKFIVDGFDSNVIYFEKEAEHPCHLLYDSDLVLFPDPELLLDNLAELKHHKLSRSVRSGVSDRDLKPNPQMRDYLHQIINYPSTKPLTSEEQDIVWKFRFYLINQKKALAKFLKCLNWDVPAETSQAVELLKKWAPMDIEDALELLSPQFTHREVRRYAVSRLSQATDEDLLLYLLQLVQALKYENIDEIDVEFLLDSDQIGEDDEAAAQSDLVTFLIHRAMKNESLANYLYWYLLVEIEGEVATLDNKYYNTYFNVMSWFSKRLQHGTPELKQRRESLMAQQRFMEQLVELMKEVAREKGDRPKKEERLRHLISTTKIDKPGSTFENFGPLPLPLDPEVKIKGIIPDKCSLFKSALMPAKLSFLTSDDKEYVAILKYGDDLRQDQLILQTITLIDKLLRRQNLDLKLMPYRVLATSSKHGFVQFVKSTPVAEILKNNNGDIQNYFRSEAPNESAPYKVSPDVMETYVRSCAGYCIITYLLGVGDRHFDNLLLTKDGHLFHIDFGYILGRDPKPFPPPMKLSREMVEAMGGVNSEHYKKFQKFCYTAFQILREHANLILNLFALMVDATIPDIALEPDKTVKKVQDKFRLDMGDEEAVHYIQTLIEVSATAMMPSLMEQVHKFAQYWRK